jgi:hypothetical protein
LKQELNRALKKEKLSKAILEIFDDSIVRFFNKSVEECEKFERFYSLTGFTLRILSHIKNVKSTRNKAEALKKIKDFFEKNIFDGHELIDIRYNFSYSHPKENILRDSLRDKFSSNFRICFDEEGYEIGVNSKNVKYPYNQQLSDEEMIKIIKTESKRHFEHLEKGLK